jgi:hypothetical protein
MLFRHEDDQFIAVLLHTVESTGMILADHLASAVAGFRGQFPFEITVSTVLAVAPTDSSNFQGLLETARHRLTGRLPPQDTRDPNDSIH